MSMFGKENFRLIFCNFSHLFLALFMYTLDFILSPFTLCTACFCFLLCTLCTTCSHFNNSLYNMFPISTPHAHILVIIFIACLFLHLITIMLLIFSFPYYTPQVHTHRYFADRLLNRPWTTLNLALLLLPA